MSSNAPAPSNAIARRGRQTQQVVRRTITSPTSNALAPFRAQTPSALVPISASSTTAQYNPSHLSNLRNSALASSGPQSSANLTTDIARFLNTHSGYKGKSAPIHPDVFVAPTDAESALMVIGARENVAKGLQRAPQRQLLLGGAGFSDDGYWHEGATLSLPQAARSASAPPSSSRGGSQGAKTSWPSSWDSFHSASSGLNPLLPLTSAYKGKGKEVMIRPRSGSGTVASGSVAIRPTIDRTDPRNQIDIQSLPKPEEDHRLL